MSVDKAQSNGGQACSCSRGEPTQFFSAPVSWSQTLALHRERHDLVLAPGNSSIKSFDLYPAQRSRVGFRNLRPKTTTGVGAG